MKSYLNDILILAIPMILAGILFVILPDQLPMKVDAAGQVIASADKRDLLLLAFVPYAGYRLRKWRKDQENKF